ncbi:MAG: hypothetical protein M3040_16130 [Bacteroidota bacterium]|nr:hypothetical protein [Bacteroidota bacterium]
MKKVRLIIFFTTLFITVVISAAHAQCSICTKTAGQLGEKRAKGLNSGIVYLMLAPFTIVGYIGFRWWKAEKENTSEAQ